MKTGTVKFFSADKGFGFITDNATGKDYFVHVSNLIDEIRENDIVAFSLETGRKGDVANSVSLVENLKAFFWNEGTNRLLAGKPAFGVQIHSGRQEICSFFADSKELPIFKGEYLIFKNLSIPLSNPEELIEWDKSIKDFKALELAKNLESEAEKLLLSLTDRRNGYLDFNKLKQITTVTEGEKIGINSYWYLPEYGYKFFGREAGYYEKFLTKI